MYRPRTSDDCTGESHLFRVYDVFEVAIGSTGLAPDVYPRVNETLVGDTNQDDHFDLGDTASFSGLFGRLASAGAAAVPEPTTLSLAVVLLIGITIRPRWSGWAVEQVSHLLICPWDASENHRLGR